MYSSSVEGVLALTRRKFYLRKILFLGRRFSHVFEVSFGFHG
jgi:hypothetical protein